MTDKRSHSVGARAGAWGTSRGRISPHPHKATPELRVLQASLLLRGPCPEDTLTVAAPRAVWPGDIYDSIPFLNLLLPRPLRVPVGLEESHVKPAGGTKKGEQRGGEQTLAFSQKSLRDPQHLLPLVRHQRTQGRLQLPRLRSGRRSGRTHHKVRPSTMSGHSWCESDQCKSEVVPCSILTKCPMVSRT